MKTTRIIKLIFKDKDALIFKNFVEIFDAIFYYFILFYKYKILLFLYYFILTIRYVVK